MQWSWTGEDESRSCANFTCSAEVRAPFVWSMDSSHETRSALSAAFSRAREGAMNKSTVQLWRCEHHRGLYFGCGGTAGISGAGADVAAGRPIGSIPPPVSQARCSPFARIGRNFAQTRHLLSASLEPQRRLVVSAVFGLSRRRNTWVKPLRGTEERILACSGGAACERWSLQGFRTTSRFAPRSTDSRWTRRRAPVRWTRWVVRPCCVTCFVLRSRRSGWCCRRTGWWR